MKSTVHVLTLCILKGILRLDFIVDLLINDLYL
jgi:hypothetical protein